MEHHDKAIDWLADSVEQDELDEIGTALLAVLRHWRRDVNYGPVLDRAIGLTLERRARRPSVNPD